MFDLGSIDRIQVYADYRSYPLWLLSRGEIVHNAHPSELEISEPLRRDLSAWAARYDEGVDWNDPAAAQWPAESAAREFFEDGRRLARRVSDELDAALPVEYVSAQFQVRELIPARDRS